MKKLNYLFLIIIIAGITTLVGCGNDDGEELDPVDQLTKRISQTWVVDESLTNQVMTPAGERTVDFADFSLTFNENNNYSTSGNPDRSPWPSSGTWSFTNVDNISIGDNQFSITRGDGLVISGNLSSEDEQLELTFEFEEGTHEGSNMRTTAVGGEWTFILVASE